VKNPKPKSKKIKATDPIGQGQQILANIIACAYQRRSRPEKYAILNLSKTDEVAQKQ
jgi:hypothetical protein